MSSQPIFKLPDNKRTAILFFILASVITLLAYGNLYTHNFWDGWDDLHILADLKIMAQNPAHMVSAEKNYQEIRPPVDVVFLAGYLL